MIRALLLPLPLLLVACQDKGAARNDSGQPGVVTNIVDQGGGTTQSSPPIANQATPADTRAPSPGLTPSGSIPTAFQGRWTGISETCSDRSAALDLSIDPRRLLFHESEGTVKSVKKDGDDKLSVTAAFTGEGESWTRTLALHMAENGTRLTIVNDGQSVTRKRC
ncbi:hypothetical protein [Sphingobium sp.]|uniref:hypothetical protein n=1 Tax=Sphingobium sp. TaxID=1912891 RepID=UPI003BB66F71